MLAVLTLPPDSSAVTSSSSCSSLMAAIPLGLPRKDAIACRCRVPLPAAAAARQAWAGGNAVQTCCSTLSSCAFSRGASAGGSGLQGVHEPHSGFQVSPDHDNLPVSTHVL